MSAALGGEASGFDEVGYDGTTGWFLARALSVEEGFACGIRFDRNGIKYSVHGSKNVLGRDERRLRANLDATVLVLTDEREEFDDVA